MQRKVIFNEQHLALELNISKEIFFRFKKQEFEQVCAPIQDKTLKE
jgi:hypothetical protein